MSNILHLTLKKKWFDMIASGVKKEEYRELKLYWTNRLHPIDAFGFRNDDVFRNFDRVVFRNGYAANAPTVTVEFKGIRIGEPRHEWAEKGNKCYIIELGEIIR